MITPVADYLKTQQPAVYDLFSRARKDQRWSHAYLIHGFSGQPLADIAQWLAQSLLCETPNPLACQSCLTCQRVLAGDFTDIIVINGEESSIKKDQVLDLTSRFAITGLEKANQQIYILHHVEAMTTEAINALLKFLEEPQQAIYALMTTERLDAVLPTIQSRSQVIHLKPIQYPQLIEAAMAKGMPAKDAEWLSLESGTVDQMLAKANDPQYQQFQIHLENFLKHWQAHPEKALYYFRQEWFPEIQDVEAAVTFINRWIHLLLQLQRMVTKQAVILKAYASMLLSVQSQIQDLSKVIQDLYARKDMLQQSTHLGLALEAMMINMLGV
jgi:DNA polymerase III subunit delta'